MAEYPTPAEVVTDLIHASAAGDIARFASLYTEDAPVEVRLELPRPLTIVGSAGVLAAMSGRDPSNLRNVEVHDLVIHETGPDEVVAEWEYRGFARATGEPYRVHNAIVTTVVNGKITRSRDYHNTVAVSTNSGGRARLLAQLADPATWAARVG
ncbi:nuclear transport factor 2 family protein [Kutzneria chonburiensis]|uniref:Nuclear transport factor 2 family protein n=1 Tax=Kutzneria chonburiensis TaxID=1483604 RepID=A0ABV6N0R4_9PSEU|nr:nuclear transport factor 2 family protein [Kutzneria chonburiensis]